MANLFLIIGFYRSDNTVVDKFKNKYRIPSARWPSWDYSSQASYFITICVKNRKHLFGEVINEQMVFSELGAIANEEWLKTPDLRPDMNIELGEFVVMPNHFHGIITIGENQFNKVGFDVADNYKTGIDFVNGDHGGDIRFGNVNGGVGGNGGCCNANDGSGGNGGCCNVNDGSGGNGGCCNVNDGSGGNGGCCRDAMHGVSTTPLPTVPPVPETPPPFEYPISFHDPPAHGFWVPPEIEFQISLGPANKFGPQSKNVGSIIRGFKSSVTTYARTNNINFKWQDRFHDHVIRNAEEYFRISKYIKNNPKNWKGDRFNRKN
jgi:REP element-mobilizing transposase RayT